MKKLKKENKGFSLVELIVVVLILGILAVAVTPQIMNWINKSKENKDLSYAGSVATAVESVALEYYGIMGDLNDATYKLDSTGVNFPSGVSTDPNPAGTNTVTSQSVADLKVEIAGVVAAFQNPEFDDGDSTADYFEITVKLVGGVVDVKVVPKYSALTSAPTPTP